ncbi:MAG: right-handed parallel beta-helix repeat-containing protein, partial [Planctomycetales bacterium]|nr:right-handed parallel beta-helix repeat-containing protein [Planctomycetales bacterium]
MRIPRKPWTKPFSETGKKWRKKAARRTGGDASTERRPASEPLEERVLLADYYVNDAFTVDDEYATASGNDANDGLAPTRPMASIHAVLERYDLGVGDTILVDSGTYARAENIVISANDAGVEIRGPVEAGHVAVIDRMGTNKTGEYVFELSQLGADGAKIDHLQIRGGEYGIFSTAANNAASSDNIVISNNEILNNSAGGIRLNAFQDGAEIHNNVIHDNNTMGVRTGIFVRGSGVSIHDNVISKHMTGIDAAAGDASTQTEIFRNIVRDNTMRGIIANDNVLAYENTVSGATDAGGVGIFGLLGAEIRHNVVHTNVIGIDAGSPSVSTTADSNNLVIENRVYNNSSIGIRADQAADVLRNVVYSNGVGIRGEAFTAGTPFAGTIQGNVVYANATHGIVVQEGGTNASNKRPQIINNTVYQTAGDAIHFQGRRNAQNNIVATSRDVDVRNNILWVTSGFDLFVESGSEVGFTSDYNVLQSTGGGQIGSLGGATFNSLTAWRNTAIADFNSFQADPLFADIDGADNVLGYNGASFGFDDDFHVSSASGRSTGSFAPILNAVSGLPEFLTTGTANDAASSPAIDRAGPTATFANEPTPNGGYRNLGAYGNTSQASRSATQFMNLLSPDGGEVFAANRAVQIRWISALSGALGNVNIQLLKGGAPVSTIASGVANNGLFTWMIPAGTTPGADYQIRITHASNGALTDSSVGNFEILAPTTMFYVDDSLNDNDEYTPGAIGSITNHGLTPNSPLSSIRTVLALYELGAGDTILVDTGTYMLSGNTVITAADAGVTIQGAVDPAHETTLNRGNTSTGSYVFELVGLGGGGVTFSDLRMTGAEHSIFAGSGSNSDGLTVRNSEFFGNRLSGIRLEVGNDLAIVEDSLFHDNDVGARLRGNASQITGNEIFNNRLGFEVSDVVLTAGTTSVFSDNYVHDNTAYGVAAINDVVVVENTVFNQQESGGVGIQATDSALVLNNVIFSNETGMLLGSLVGVDATDIGIARANRIYDNDVGVQADRVSVVEQNIVYNNRIGIRGAAQSGGTFNGVVENNIVYANTETGIDISDARLTDGLHARVINNTFYNTEGDALRIGEASVDVEINSNIFSISGGHGLAVDATNTQQFTSDFNLFHVTPGGTAGRINTFDLPTLQDVKNVIFTDANSFATDPLFVDPDGADNSLGFVAGSSDGRDDDFHLRSQFGRFTGALAPYADQATKSVVFLPTTELFDAASSPAIDRADPALRTPLIEPENNGGYRNLGAYGNTTQASKSAAEFMQVLSPNGGEFLIVDQVATIRWISDRPGALGNVRIELLDGGVVERVISASTPNSTGEFEWMVPADAPISTNLTIRITHLNDATLTDTSDAPFRIIPPVDTYYVNDASTAGDILFPGETEMMAVGSGANTGLAPDSPRPSIRSILGSYDLQDGDRILVNTGDYPLVLNILVTGDDGGAAIVGAGRDLVTLDRGGTDVGDYAFEFVGLGDQGFTLEGLGITNAYRGVYASNTSQSDNLVIRDNKFSAISRDAINLMSGNSQAIITGNLFDNVDAGLRIQGGGDLVEGNEIINARLAVQALGFDPLMPQTLVRNNVVTQDTPRGGGIAVEGNVLAEGNTVSGYLGSGSWGMLVNAGAEVRGNVLFDNTRGLLLGSILGTDETNFGIAVGNIIYNNDMGIQADRGSIIRENAIYSNRIGISGEDVSDDAGFHGLIENNLVYANTESAIVVHNGDVVTVQVDNENVELHTRVYNNTIYQPIGNGLVIEGDSELIGEEPDQTLNILSSSEGVDIRNNIFTVGEGFAISIQDGSHIGLASDFNFFQTSGTGQVGRFGNFTAATLADWFNLLLTDVSSNAGDPRFVDPDGADNVLGFVDGVSTGIDAMGNLEDDFHLRSTVGRYLNDGTEAPAVDGVSSPAIDLGDPSFTERDANGMVIRVRDEPTPNGGYINLGRYGGTEFASKSVEPFVTVLSPNGGEIFPIGQRMSVRFRNDGDVSINDPNDASVNGNLTFELLINGNSFPSPVYIVPDIVNPDDLEDPYGILDGEFTWTIPDDASLISNNLRLKITQADPLDQANKMAMDTSDADFAIRERVFEYYINDGVLDGDDIHTTATGSNANSGLDPSSPMASLQALLGRYDLSPGDIVYVDSGTYVLPTNITVTGDDTGITILGVAGDTPGVDPPKTIFDRANTGNNANVFDFEGLGSDGIVIDSVLLRGGQQGIVAANNTGNHNIEIRNSWLEGFTRNAVFVGSGNNSWTIQDNVFMNSDAGVRFSSGDLLMENNKMVDNRVAILSLNSMQGALSTVRNNQIQQPGRGGGIVGFGNTIVELNTVTGATNAGSYGVFVSSGGVAQNNVLFGNTIGVLSGTITVADDTNYGIAIGNRLYDNDIGISADRHSEIRENVVYSNRIGIRGTDQTSNGGFYGLIENNLVYANEETGILIDDAAIAEVVGFGVLHARIFNNTVYQTTGNAIRIQGESELVGEEPDQELVVLTSSEGVELKNNIVVGQGDFLISVQEGNIDNPLGSASGLQSDFNLFRVEGGSQFGEAFGFNFDSLLGWRNTLFLDDQSITADPSFVDIDGPDNILGFQDATSDGRDDDFHLRTDAGRYTGSPAPVIDVATGLPVFLPNDLVTTDLESERSGAIDRGAPLADGQMLLELDPNGGFVNLGAFGNTELASHSPSEFLIVTNPDTQATFFLEQSVPIRWISDTVGAAGNVKIELFDTLGDDDPGNDVFLRTISSNTPNDGLFNWFIPDSVEISRPDTFDRLVRITHLNNATLVDESDEAFQITINSNFYYVNDNSIAGDVFTNAIGSPTNHGLDPNFPKASIQGILNSYDLGPNDTILVDTGLYSLLENIVIDAEDAGVRIRGVTGDGIATVIDRGNTGGGNFVFDLTAQGLSDVTIEELTITGGANAVRARVPGVVIRNNEIFGNNNGIDVAVGFGQEPILVENNLVYDNDRYGIVVNQNSIARGNTVSGHLDADVAGILAIVGGTAEDNVIFNNATGVIAGTTVNDTPADFGVVTGNRIYNNAIQGILADQGSIITANRVYSNPVGIVAEASNENVVFYGLIESNLVYDNATEGIIIRGAGTFDGASTRLYHNTVVQNAGNAIRIQGESVDVQMQHNILETDGSGFVFNFDPDSQTGVISDRNLVFVTGAARVGRWNNSPATALSQWQVVSNQDRASTQANPRFVDPDGADGILGYNSADSTDYGLDDDFHLLGNSPAIDRAGGVATSEFDLEGFSRLDDEATANNGLLDYRQSTIERLELPTGMIEITPGEAQVLPFTFGLYGNLVSEITIHEDGYIDLSPSGASDPINTTDKLLSNVRIAPLWANLRLDGPDDGIFFSATSSRAVIYWNATNVADDSEVNFAAVLLPNGEVQFHYYEGNTNLTPTVGISGGDGRKYQIAAYNGVGTLTNANSIYFQLANGFGDYGAFEYRGRSLPAEELIVTGTTPSAIHASAELSSMFGPLLVHFSEPLDVENAMNAANYTLRWGGADLMLDPDDIIDDEFITLIPSYIPGSTTLTLLLVDGPLLEGDYRFTINADSGVIDLDSTELDGDENGAEGGDYVREYTLASVEFFVELAPFTDTPPGPDDPPLPAEVTEDETDGDNNTFMVTVGYTSTLTPGVTASVAVDYLKIDAIETRDFNQSLLDAMRSYINNTSPPGVSAETNGNRISFLGGEGNVSSITFPWTVRNDLFAEGPETFAIQLSEENTSDGSPVFIDVPSVNGTILDDDEIIFKLIADDVEIEVTEDPDDVVTPHEATYTISYLGALDDPDPDDAEPMPETVSVDVALLFEGTAEEADFETTLIAALDAAVTAANANALVDFVARQGSTIIFFGGAGQPTSLTFTLPVLNDMLAEGDEMLRAAISNPQISTLAPVSISMPQVPTTILDDDAVVFSVEALNAPTPLSNGIPAVTEDPADGDNNLASFTIRHTSLLPTGVTASVEVIDDLNEAEPEDFSLRLDAAISAAVAALPAGAGISWDGTRLSFTGGPDALSELTFDVEVADDPRGEADEIFQVLLVNAGITNPADVLVGAGLAQTVILDDDGITVDLSGPAEVFENPADGDTEATYTISYQGELADGVMIAVDVAHALNETKDIDYADTNEFQQAIGAAAAATPGVDWDGTTLTFTVGPGNATSLPFTLRINNDDLAEGPETYRIELANMTVSVPTSNTSIVTPAIATTINDDDSLAFTLTGSDRVTEDPADGDNNEALYTIEYTGTLDVGETAMVDLALVFGQTVAADFDETLIAAIDRAIAGGVNGITRQNSTLTFAAGGDQTFTFGLFIADDLLAEGDETFQIVASNLVLSTGQPTVIDPTSVSTTIIDDDGIPFFLSGDANVTEDILDGDGNMASYTIRYEGSLANGLEVSVDLAHQFGDTVPADFENDLAGALADAVALLNPADGITASGTTVTFRGGPGALQSLTFQLQIRDDAISEGPEIYMLEALNPQTTSTASVFVSPTDATVETTIEDDDSIEFSIVGSQAVTEDENDGDGNLATYTISYLNLIADGARVSIDVAHDLNEAEAEDFVDLADALNLALLAAAAQDANVEWDGTTLTFIGGPATPASLDFSLEIAPDERAEGDEMFGVVLSNPQADRGAAVVDVDRADTTIIEDDEIIFSFDGSTVVTENPNDGDMNLATYTVSYEGLQVVGGEARINVSTAIPAILPPGTTGTEGPDFTETLRTALENAAARPENAHITVENLTVVFHGEATAGEAVPTDFTFSWGIVDDDLAEGDEVFNMAIGGAQLSTTANVSVDPTMSSELTRIVDNDEIVFQLTGRDMVTEDPFDLDLNRIVYTLSFLGGLPEGDTASVAIEHLPLDTTVFGDPEADYTNDLLEALRTAQMTAVNVDLDEDDLRVTFNGGVGNDTSLTFTLLVNDDTLAEGDEALQTRISGEVLTNSAPISIDQTTVDTIIKDDDSIDFMIVGDILVTEDPTDPDMNRATYTISYEGDLPIGAVAMLDVTHDFFQTNSDDFLNSLQSAMDNGTSELEDSTVVPTNVRFVNGVLEFEATDHRNITFELIVATDSITEGDEIYNMDIGNARVSNGAAATPAADSLATTIIDFEGEVVLFARNNPTSDISVTEAPDADNNTQNHLIGMINPLGAGQALTVELRQVLLSAEQADFDYGADIDFSGRIASAVSTVTGISYTRINATSGTLTFDGGPGNALQFPVDFTIVDDTFAEGVERYTFEFADPILLTNGVPTGDDVFVEPVVPTTIVDDDELIVTIVGTPEVTEDDQDADGNVASYTISYTGDIEPTHTLTVDVSHFLNLAESEDFAAQLEPVLTAAANAISTISYTAPALTFQAGGERSISFDLNIVNDVEAEGNETYSIRLGAPRTTNGATPTFDNSEAETTIIDDDGVIFTLDADPRSVPEDNPFDELDLSTVDFTLSFAGELLAGTSAGVDISHDLFQTLLEDYNYDDQRIDGTGPLQQAIEAAVASADGVTYDGTTLTFEGGAGNDTQLRFTLTIASDMLAEGDEIFAVELANGFITTASTAAIATPRTEVTITDNDDVLFSISGAPQVTEDPTDDDNNEAIYTIRHTSILVDGETASVDVAHAFGDTDELDFVGGLNALDDALTAATAALPLVTWDGTTLTFMGGIDAVDFVDFTLTIADDMYAEGDEIYGIDLSNPQVSNTANVGIDVANASTTIIDDDSLDFSITGPEFVSEDPNDGNIAVYVVGHQDLIVIGEQASIHISHLLGETADADYEGGVGAFREAVEAAVADLVLGGVTNISFDSVNDVLTFRGAVDAATSLTIELVIFDDVLVEGDETYQVQISDLQISNNGAGMIVPGEDIVSTTIADSDSGAFVLSASDTVTEDPTDGDNNQVVYTVSFTGSLDDGETASVDILQFLDDTNAADFAQAFTAAIDDAIAQVSGVSRTGERLTFTGGAGNASELTFALDIENDSIAEGDEFYRVRLENPATSTNFPVTIKLPREIETLIVDDDTFFIGIAGDDQVLESDILSERTANYTIGFVGEPSQHVRIQVDVHHDFLDTVGADFTRGGTALSQALTAATRNLDGVDYDSDTGM